MPNLTAAQARDTALSFLHMAQAIGDYRINSWNELSTAENRLLSDRQWSILNATEDMLALSTTLVMSDVKPSLEKLKTVSEQIGHTLKNLKNVQKVITVSGAIISLGGAVLSKNPLSVAKALNELIDSWEI